MPVASRPTLHSEVSQARAGTLPCDGRDDHLSHVMALRRDRGFVTPLSPIEEGDAYCVCSYPGMWEWLFHPADAARYLATGIRVDGRPCKVECVGEYPLMGAVQIRAAYPDRHD